MIYPDKFGDKSPTITKDTSLNADPNSSYTSKITEPVHSSSETGAFGGYGSTPALKTKDTAGAVSQPSYGGYPDNLAKTHSAPTNNPETDLNPGIQGADGGAKWERPHPQDVPDKGRNQFSSLE